ncbi:F-box domain containing protein [Pandoravirus salinus]|uniref:F-box domain containing protein n=1 Tax=Pandoravirus salinus TaxID=1349410 RepID=A0A291ATJ0_9VIRU|nr:F-box domain [Pandoravirus salinus]ATE82210.1 F-box domain containing protein [Pandoravirus salinus]
MEKGPLSAFGRLTLDGAATSRRRARPVDCDAPFADPDAIYPPAARRRRLDVGSTRWKRKRIDDPRLDPVMAAVDTIDAAVDVDSVASLMHKRLRVADDQKKVVDARPRCQHTPEGERAQCIPGGSFSVLPDELALAIMAFCDARSLTRLACVSTRLAGLASDNLLWRGLYLATLLPCTRGRGACLGEVVDAWCFAADDRCGDDALDHGPSTSTAPGAYTATDLAPASGRVCLTTSVSVARVPPLHSWWPDKRQDDGHGHGGGDNDNNNNYGHDDDDEYERIQSLGRWWDKRCTRLTRSAAHRVTGCSTTPAHPGCPHPPPSLVRARGYRWAYAVAATAPLVRKVHRDTRHSHCIVHRGPRDGLAFQCETCLAIGGPCGVVWRWGRFVDCFLSGLGTETTSVPREGAHRADIGIDTPSDEMATQVVAGVWFEGVTRGTVVRRIPSTNSTTNNGNDGGGDDDTPDEMIVVGTAIADNSNNNNMRAYNDPMDRDPTARAQSSERDDESGTDDSGTDDHLATEGDGIYDDGEWQHASATVIYYAPQARTEHAWSYRGECVNDERHGHGVLACEVSASPLYEGDWRRNMWHGRGILRVEASATGPALVYTGRFVHGRPRGRGTLDLGDGTRVEASWHSLSDGSVAPRRTGHIVYANGDRVLCDWARPTVSRSGQDRALPFGLDVVVKGFRFADSQQIRGDLGARSFSGREVGAEWGPWPTEYDEAIVIDPQAAQRLPRHCGGDGVFCARGWTVVLPCVFWPPPAHPLEPLFARYVDENRIGWSVRAPRAAP